MAFVSKRKRQRFLFTEGVRTGDSIKSDPPLKKERGSPRHYCDQENVAARRANAGRAPALAGWWRWLTLMVDHPGKKVWGNPPLDILHPLLRGVKFHSENIYSRRSNSSQKTFSLLFFYSSISPRYRENVRSCPVSSKFWSSFSEIR